MSTKKYKYFIFDMDGTLEDTRDAVIGAYREMAKRRGTGEYSEQYLNDHCFIMAPKPGLAAIGITENVTEEVELLCRLAYENNDKVKVYPGVKELLRALKEKGAVLAISTGRDPQVFGFDSQFEDVLPLFSEIMHSEYAPRPKPYPDALLMFFDKYGARPEEVLFIGDAASDYGAASAAGVDFALAGWSDCADRSLPAQYIPSAPQELLTFAEE